MARVLSVDPGRSFPGISLWEDDKLVGTWRPSFKGKKLEDRVKKIVNWIDEDHIWPALHMDLVIIESNSTCGGREIGCAFAGMFAGVGVDIITVHPVTVAKWAEKKFNLELIGVPRSLKKKRTKELIELLLDRENLSFDEADSCLNFLYWQDVRKRPIRHHDLATQGNPPNQPGTTAPL